MRPISIEFDPMHHFFLTRLFLISLAKAGLLIALTLSLCSSRPLNLLERILATGELRVVSIKGPNTLFEGPDGIAGFEFQLAEGFADKLGLKLVLIEADSTSNLFDILRENGADIAASHLAVTESRKQAFLFSPAYTLSNTRFYYRYGNGMPRSWEDVKGRDILISSHSHHEELLLSMKQQYPWLKWRVDREHKPYQLMQLVQNEQADLIVLDSNTFLLNQGLFPKVRPALQIGKEKPMAWAVTKNHDLSFYHAIAHYFSLIEEDGTLDNLKDIYFEHMSAMNSGGSNMFYQRIKTRLPRYEALFKKAADDFQLDWHLLAAMSYQESFWNPKAVSPTGVRGLMMLTRSTAGSLGISDRSDPEQSVMGGAAYFSSIREQLDSNIAEPDRTWLALAAYNAGLGHLEDARTLTQRYGGDPKKWADVKKHFPFLMQKTHYSTVKYGYARGEETVNYVQRIRQYYSILTWRSRMQVFTGR